MIFSIQTASTWVSFIFTILSLVVYIITLIFTLRKAVKNFKNSKDDKFDALSNKIDTLDTAIKEIKEQQDKNERDRLKDIIIEFADKIICNHKKGEDIFELNKTNFEHVFRTYEKYKCLGGNGYIDAEMELIRQEFNNHY